MITLKVELGRRSYPILIGNGLLARTGLLDEWLRGRDVLVLTNETLAPIYLEPVKAMLGRSRIATAVLPDGEAHKTLATVSGILDTLCEQRFNRDGVLLSLGGGVVGDIGGFSAAIYQRGIDFIQVPTTLLAQVDSAVGGKTGVNHPAGKNLIGAFHQPLCVLADTDTLQTLPERELSAGLAEVIKYGMLADPALFDWLERHADQLLRREPAALHHVIRRSCEIKAAIVAEDERERGLRALLNLGHTFGHAIERCSGYGQWLHGEAVAAGLCMAAAFSEQLGWIEAGDVRRVRTLVERLRLPVAPPRTDPGEFLAAMGMDKKVLDGRIRLVLLKAIGEAVVVADYPPAELKDLLKTQLRTR